MTKNNKLLLTKIQDADLEFTDAQIEFITTMLESAGKVGSKHPNIFNDEGLEEKWCSRHLQYELLTEWTAQKSGKLESCCDIALKQWREYDKNLKELKKLTREINDTKVLEDIAAHSLKVQEAEDIRSGSYEYPTELAEVIKTEKTPIKPKRGSKK